MRHFSRWTFTLMLITFAARLGAYTVPYETWMGAYIGEKKVGYVSLKVDKGEYNGVKGYRAVSVLSNRLTVLGTELTQLITTLVYTDEQYNPLMEDFSMSSGGKTTRIKATFGKDSIQCTISAGSGSSVKTVPIPDGASLIGDPMFATGGAPVAVGKEYLLHYFNPLTLTVDELKIKAERNEKITVGGKDYEAVVVTNQTPMGDMTVWQDPAGEVLKVRAMMGITMLRESREDAPKGIGSGTADDFAVLTSVKPNRQIPSPRKCKELQVKIGGLSGPDMIIADSRQAVSKVDGDPESVLVRVKALSFNADKARTLPITAPELQDDLASTPYIDYDVQDVSKASSAIVGDEKNAYRVCSKIRTWVHANMQTRADIGITRSASDVLESKVGVCRDYAILFAGLARAAGVPTRVAAGLLFTDKAFYYHAWVECFVGEWVPFDATLADDFVDATHIKLAEGDATSMYGLARVIGSLKIDVVSSK